MSTLEIEEKIAVSAAPDKVFALLLDPARVASCLPGARFDGAEGDGTFLGTMKVKVGPVTMEFKGKATMNKVDEAARSVELVGTGNDKGGSGSAKMTMESKVLAIEGGGAEIIIKAHVDLAGKLVSFGRGMMVGISKQMFKQFADKMRAELARADEEDKEDEEEERAEAVPAKAEEPVKAEEPAKAEEPKAPSEEPAKVEEPKAPAEEPAKAEEAKAPSEEPAKVAPVEEPANVEEPKAVAEEPLKTEEPAIFDEPKAISDEPKAVSEEPKAASGEPANAAPAKPKKKKPKAKPAALAPRPQEDNAPLDAGGLFWAALWAWIKGFFQRIFGKKGE